MTKKKKKKENLELQPVTSAYSDLNDSSELCAE